MIRQEIDIILIQKAKAGNQRAFTCLFDHYYHNVHRYINSIIKNFVESEDLAMIVMEKVFRKIDSYYPLYTFKSWIMKIARNVSLDFLKRKMYIFTEISEGIKSGIENPEERLIRIQTTERIENSINNLQDNYRKVIKLHYYEDCSCNDICEKLNINLQTTLSHLFRARQKLIKSLAS